jgi:hypothetical protein
MTGLVLPQSARLRCNTKLTAFRRQSKRSDRHCNAATAQSVKRRYRNWSAPLVMFYAHVSAKDIPRYLWIAARQYAREENLIVWIIASGGEFNID